MQHRSSHAPILTRPPARALRLSLAAFAAALLTGCLSGPAVVAPAAVAPVADGPPPVTGWLAGPAAPALDQADRERAFAAEIAAAESGRRSSWRSASGHFGLVEPGPEAAGAGGVCRPFNHTIYIDGRAQRGQGTACRSAAGAWGVTG